MAYNPFHVFRRHQKVIFAGLTILCMFVFVLATGKGDFFEQVLGAIRERRGTGATVTKLGSKTVTEGDLDHLRQQRKLASDFIRGAVTHGQFQVMDELLKSELQESDLLAGVVRTVQAQFQGRPINDDSSMRTIRDEAAKAKDDPDRLRLVERVATVFGFLIWSTTQQLTPNQLYMGGTNQIEDMLDFLIWRQQADKLAISLTEADVMRAINAEAAGHPVFDPDKKTFDREPRVLAFMKVQGDRRLKTSDLLDALRQEFRVSMAKELVTGMPSGTRLWRLLEGAATPAVGTPDEFLAFYREKTTALKVSLLRVPVKAFVQDVKATPSEADLRSLFTQYRDKESAPARREPGFKLSRRVKASYAIGSAEDPYFVSKGREIVWGKGGKPGASQAGGIAGVFADWRRARDVLLIPAMPIIGAGPGGVLAIASRIGCDPIQIAYSRYLDKGHAWAHEDAPLPSQELHVELGKVIDGGAVATMMAGASNPLATLNTLWATATYRDVKPALLTNLGQLMGKAENPLGFAALSALAQPRTVSRPVVEPQILSELTKSFARDAFQATMKEFGDKVKAAATAKAANEVIAKAAAAAHLTLHSMPRAVTRAVVTDELSRKNDLNLDALRKLGEEPLTPFEAMLEGPRFRNQVPPRLRGTPESVAGFLFGPLGGTFQPTPIFREDSHKKQGLFWRTEDHSPELRTFEQARADVEAAWRIDQARQLARKAALSLVEKINARKNTARDARAILAEARARDPRLGAIFEMDNVALMTPIPETRAGLVTQYRSYQMPADVLAEMPYPPADLFRLFRENKRPGDPEDLVKDLLKLERPGQAKVIVDMPARDFYVAVLEERSPQTFNEFAKVYARTPRRDKLHEQFEVRRRTEYYRAVVEQLRREAVGRLGKDGRIEVPAEARKRFSGSSASDD